MKNPNTLQIQSLSGDWCDKDLVMLHACFQLLTDGIENENLLTAHTNWEDNTHFKRAKVELIWWTERKTKFVENKTNEIAKDQYEEDNKMLTRLISVRQFLWT